MMPYAAAVAVGRQGRLARDGAGHFEDQRARRNRAADRGFRAAVRGRVASVKLRSRSLPGLICGGIGNAIAFVALMAVATETVPAQEQGVASGALLAAQQLGVAIGVAIVLMGLSSGGFTGGFLTAGVFGLSAMLVVATATRAIRRPGGTSGHMSPEGPEAV